MLCVSCSKTPKPVMESDCLEVQKAAQMCQLDAAQVKQMMAVLSEQLNAAQPAEQQKICQSAMQFWQAACGVAR
jgi:hypothetical protein